MAILNLYDPGPYIYVYIVKFFASRQGGHIGGLYEPGAVIYHHLKSGILFVYGLILNANLNEQNFIG